MPRLTPQRLVRAVAVRLRSLARGLVSDSVLAAARVRNRVSARFAVPARYWPVERVGAGTFLEQWLPLPAVSGLSTWFGLAPREGNDGGDLSANRVLIQVAAQATPDSFKLASLRSLLTHRHALDERAHTVILTSRAEEANTVRRLLRGVADGRGVVLVPSPTPTQLQAIFSVASALFVPGAEDEAQSEVGGMGLLAQQAQASGRPVVAIGHDQPLPFTLDAALASEPGRDPRSRGRAARLEALRATVDIATYEPQVWQPLERDSGARIRDRPRRILVASHDLKFAHPVIDALRAGGHEVRIDHWSGHARHDPAASGSLLAWADVVWCEWALGNAVWYSKRIGRHQRLVVRMHLQEAATPFPAAIRWGSVDRALFVAEHVRRKVELDTVMATEQSRVIPNIVTIPNTVFFDNAARRFRVGLVGMVPARKGLREALDVLAELRALEPRFTLSLRGRRPEEYAWMSDRPAEKAYFDREFDRIRSEPQLEGAVEFSPYGADMSSWYSQVGVVLSTSDFESFHYTIPDGAVHGALPRLLNWPGADLLYPARWMQASPRELAHDIYQSTRDEHHWLREIEQAREFVRRSYGSERVMPELLRELLGTRG